MEIKKVWFCSKRSIFLNEYHGEMWLTLPDLKITIEDIAGNEKEIGPLQMDSGFGHTLCVDVKDLQTLTKAKRILTSKVSTVNLETDMYRYGYVSLRIVDRKSQELLVFMTVPYVNAVENKKGFSLLGLAGMQMLNLNFEKGLTDGYIYRRIDLILDDDTSIEKEGQPIISETEEKKDQIFNVRVISLEDYKEIMEGEGNK